jgi:hypothetical protein
MYSLSFANKKKNKGKRPTIKPFVLFGLIPEPNTKIND